MAETAASSQAAAAARRSHLKAVFLDQIVEQGRFYGVETASRQRGKETDQRVHRAGHHQRHNRG